MLQKEPQRFFQLLQVRPRHTVDTNQPQGLLQLQHMHTCTAVSSNVRQLAVCKGFINILYTHIFDYNRLNYAKDVSNRDCCATCKCQSKLSVPTHLDKYVKSLFCTCPDMSHSLIVRECTYLHFAQDMNQEEETGSIKREVKRHH